MKTIAKLFLLLGVVFVGSCTQPTDMLTVINSDGSCYREFSANADEAFLRGDKSEEHNPFPVVIDSTWEIRWSVNKSGFRNDFPLSKAILDSIKKATANAGKNGDENSTGEFVVVAHQDYSTVEEMDREFKLKSSNEWSKIKVRHSLDIKFRWFYTYYTYRETYPMIKTGFELPIENYMTKDEARFWFTGEPDILKGMNGVEVNEYVNRIESNYNKWVVQNLWNAEYKVLLGVYDQLTEKPVTKGELQSLRDSIFVEKVNQSEDFDMEKTLNSFFKTSVFTELWKTESSPMRKFEKNLDKKFAFLFSQSFNYKLILPGEVIQSGDALIQGDTLAWKLSTYRLIPSAYVIEAQSRKANLWAFVLTGVMLLGVAGWFVWQVKR
jgi:hypothetical protein